MNTWTIVQPASKYFALGQVCKSILPPIAGYIISGFFIISLPIWVGAVIDDLGISERLGGYLGSLEIGSVSTSMLISSRYVHFINKRTFAIAGGLLSVLANLGSAMMESLILLSIARILVGLGLGTLLVCTLATAARTNKSQHTFAYMEASLAVAASAFYIISAHQIENFGSAGVFITIALIQLAFVPLLALIPKDKFAQKADVTQTTNLAAIKWSSVFANGFFYCGMFSFWTFVSRIGASLDISHIVIGNVLSIAFVASLISTLSVPFLVNRVGYRATLTWTVFIMAMAGFSLTHAIGLIMFAVAVIVLKFHFLLYSTMMNGMFAKSDTSGSTNGYGLSFAIIGSAVGPAIGGEILSHDGYGLLGWTTCLIWALCLPVLFSLARGVDVISWKLSHPKDAWSHLEK